MEPTSKNALRYIKNAGEGATEKGFLDDWEPVGVMLWMVIYSRGWVRVFDGKIQLTEAGESELGYPDPV